MKVKSLRNEIMWDYDVSSKVATKLINKYRKQGRYEELCNIVISKRITPDFD